MRLKQRDAGLGPVLGVNGCRMSAVEPLGPSQRSSGDILRLLFRGSAGRGHTRSFHAYSGPVGTEKYQYFPLEARGEVV